MAFILPGAFDPNAYSPASGGGKNLPVSGPDGHVVVITNADSKEVANKPGVWMLVLTLRIVEGPASGTEGDYRLNIGSDSMDAIRIAMSELSALCHVIGHLQPVTDTSVLFNRPFRVVVGMQKGEEAAKKGYTQIEKVLDVHGRPAGKQGGAPGNGPSPAPQPSPNSFPPPQPQIAQPQQPTQPQAFPGSFPAPQQANPYAQPQAFPGGQVASPFPVQSSVPIPGQGASPFPGQQQAPAPAAPTNQSAPWIK